MINRINGTSEIYNRILVAKDTIGISTYRRNPTQPVEKENLTTVFMHESIDNPIKTSKRGNLEYPYMRQLDIILEIICLKTTDVFNIYQLLRQTVLANEGHIIDGVIARELRTEGPYGYGIPNVWGLKLIIGMKYIDEGV